MTRLFIRVFLGCMVLCAPASAAQTGQTPQQVGPMPAGGYAIPTSQLMHPAGQSVEFNGRPVDLVLSPDGKSLYVKDNRGLVVIDAVTWTIRQEPRFPEGGSSMHGIAVTRDGGRVYATTARSQIWEAKVSADGTLVWGQKIEVPGPDGTPGSHAYPCGIALSPDGRMACVCLSRNNSLGIVDLESGRLVKEIPVGIAPFDVVVKDGLAFVSDWGGRHPKKGERTGKSSGTDALVDSRGVGCSGAVSVVDLVKDRELTEVETGLHSSDVVLSADRTTLYVANANSDTVSVIDARTRRVVETIVVRPDPSLPFGSAPNALALSKDGKTLYVANGGNNAIAAVSLRRGGRSRSSIRGFIPTAWYPGALATDGRNLYVANVKGLGSRGRHPGDKGWMIYQFLGTVSKVAIPSEAVLRTYTSQVRADARVPQALRALEKAVSGKKPVPVPERTGEPSVFEHVVYVIKENKTYDQVLGDLPKGNSDPSLCVFGRDISPNHHALAEQFVLLDNYYCNGVNSADGHSWATEGYVTDYLEKSFGGFTRSYPFGGDDALSISSSGLIWDDVLANGLSFRNYGEGDYADSAPHASWSEIYQDHLNGTHRIKYAHSIAIERLRRYSCPEYPGWNMGIPDAARADIFLREFDKYERQGDWPDFMIVYLPEDHTAGGGGGTPTPRAEVAGNDQALGRIVQAISKSRYWSKTCIFVIEDDPQSGWDHVDGHRSFCFVVSPYTKRGVVISQFYNQTSVLHTMERILGIPPMNQMDAMAPLMTECFTSKPDFTAYTCLPNVIPLDEMPTKTSFRYEDGNSKSAFARPDQIDDDKLNRVIWRLAKGPDVPYPAQFAGAHGTGLKALNLVLTGQ